jgi:hypothetical protein
MIGRICRYWRAIALFTPSAAAAALVALTAGSSPAHAFWIGVGGPYWGAGPYWGYPAPYPYYPAPAYYPPPGYYPPAAAPMPTVASAAPQATSTTTTATPTPKVTYTKKPAFTNSAGQSCREYKTTGSGHDVYGTACKQADGQWRVAN